MNNSVSVLQKNYSGNSAGNEANEKPRILFVDDDIAVILSLKRSMRDEFHVEVALGAEQALQILEQTGPVAAIVSDMKMPDIDGANFLAEAKKRAPTTTRIMLTGDMSSDTSIKAINTGQVFRFLQKPYPLPSLRRVLRDAVDEHKRLGVQERMSGDLLSMFQHEFRTPLHQMMGFASLLQADDLDKETIQNYAQAIQNSGDALIDMTDNLVLLTCLREAQIKPDIASVSIQNLLEDIKKNLAPRLEEKQLDLEISLDPELSEIAADSMLLAPAIRALFSNAIKFSDVGKMIYVNVGFHEASRSIPVIDVINGGSGIDAERIKQLKEPFIQQDMGTKRAFGGLGLGLPLVQAIMAIHDGNLEIQSEPGVGVRTSLVFSHDAVCDSLSWKNNSLHRHAS